MIKQGGARAYERLPERMPKLETIDELMALQEQVECDMKIYKPDGTGKRYVELIDP